MSLRRSMLASVAGQKTGWTAAHGATGREGVDNGERAVVIDVHKQHGYSINENRGAPEGHTVISKLCWWKRACAPWSLSIQSPCHHGSKDKYPDVWARVATPQAARYPGQYRLGPNRND